MTTLIIGTNTGNVYIYDLPKALENERIISKKRKEMGVEEDLIYTYLDRLHINEFLDHL